MADHQNTDPRDKDILYAAVAVLASRLVIVDLLSQTDEAWLLGIAWIFVQSMFNSRSPEVES